MLETGASAPEFTLPDQTGAELTLSDLAGHWVALWWYPMAATPG